MRRTNQFKWGFKRRPKEGTVAQLLALLLEFASTDVDFLGLQTDILLLNK